MLGVTRAINKQVKQNSEYNIKYSYRKKKNYKFLIHSPYVKHWHQFTARKLESVINTVLGLDESGPSIQIFYVFLMRQGIVIYMEVNNLSPSSMSAAVEKKDGSKYDSIFAKFEALFTGDLLGVNFKQDLIAKLKLYVDKIVAKEDLGSISIQMQEIAHGLEYNPHEMANISIGHSGNHKSQNSNNIVGGNFHSNSDGYFGPGNSIPRLKSVASMSMSSIENGHNDNNGRNSNVNIQLQTTIDHDSQFEPGARARISQPGAQ